MHLSYNPIRRKRQIFLLVVVGIVFLLVFTAGMIRRSYSENLRPVSNDTTTRAITVKPGSTASSIATTLKDKGVIRSDWAFEYYVRTHELRDELKAGTYLVSPSQSVSEIVQMLTSGRVATDLVVILPAKRLDQIRAGLIKDGFSESSVDEALDPSQYKDHPALRDKPEGASLEGYLYPESFQKTAETTAKDVIKLSLDEMNAHMTADIRSGFSKQGLTVHQGIIFASIVEQEVSDKNQSDRAQVAQVFLKRYKQGMSLGSDPTAFYGAAIAGQPKNLNYDSPFNTRMHSGLPPGPIGNVSESALKAVAFPAGTDWLYFVSGDDGKTYFSKNLKDHEALTKERCRENCNY